MKGQGDTTHGDLPPHRPPPWHRRLRKTELASNTSAPARDDEGNVMGCSERVNLRRLSQGLPPQRGQNVVLKSLESFSFMLGWGVAAGMEEFAMLT